MEQRAILSDRHVRQPGFALGRDTIRARLSRPRVHDDHGDVATATRLMNDGALHAYDADRYGPLPSSGIPYDRAAGAPGVTAKRVPAAVLVPLVERVDGFGVLLTLRPSAMKRHGGQVAFPGGRTEPGDTDPVATALREASEEIGLDPAAVDILGRLDPYLTITGYEVVPVVGAVAGPVTLVPDPVEVADVFEVPLSLLMDPANHQRVERVFNGMRRAYYAVPYGERYIWGATAGMILNLYDILNRTGD
jgi:8-oxo-dGTP pyrophosphatase MutT (NUDIX family)